MSRTALAVVLAINATVILGIIMTAAGAPAGDAFAAVLVLVAWAVLAPATVAAAMHHVRRWQTW